MTLKHNALYAAARDAIRALFEDTSVEPEDTRASLNDLKCEIETLIETLPEED